MTLRTLRLGKNHPRLRRIAAVILFAWLSLLGAGILVRLLGTLPFHYGPFSIEVRTVPAWPWHGETRLIFPPLGEVRAHTHPTPLALNVELRGVSFDQLKAFLANLPKRVDLEQDFKQWARVSLLRFALWQIFLGALGGTLAPLVLRRRDGRVWLGGLLIGGGMTAIVLGLTGLTFHEKAFTQPSYTGSLREAPAVIGLARTAFTSAETLAAKLGGVAENLNTLYGRLQSAPVFDAGIEAETIRVLHISDIHNNPAAVRFVRDLAARFRVDFVADTGDLTDFGTPVEMTLVRGLADLPVPYVFVAGNHDSRATVAAIRKNPRAIVLDGEEVEIAGLRLIGSPDPSSLRNGAGNVDTTPEQAVAQGESLAAALEVQPTPDAALVHNPRAAAPLIGKVAVVLAGHIHRLDLIEENGTVVCNAGTTGAAGWRYFDQKQGVAFSAEILTFARPKNATERPRLITVDQVKLEGSLREYTITRHAFAPISASRLTE